MFLKKAYSATLALCLVAGWQCVAVCEVLTGRFENTDFELELVDELTFEKGTGGEVLLIGKNPEGGFPTLNIIAVPGALRADKSVEDRIKEVEDSYRASGFDHVRAGLWNSEVVSGIGFAGKVLPLSVVYSRGDEVFEARVLLFNGLSAHYYLTIIAYKDAPGLEALAQQVVAGLRLKTAAGNFVDEKSNYGFTVIVVLGIVLLGFLAVLYIKQR